ncbi:unnamed protein product [Meganyctiphanes norvegica]|uniref:F-box domain-containing protein n=1 Tax=Meganyctiphanes norvegica TaxID=48144 RepID=A0AAV2Q5V3_MEGNR
MNPSSADINRTHETCDQIIDLYNIPKHISRCEIITCPFGCGHRYLQCKQNEHKLLCGHIKVSCVNAGYGCTSQIQKRFMWKHIPMCPAFVVVCPCTWKRWFRTSEEEEDHKDALLVFQCHHGVQKEFCLFCKHDHDQGSFDRSKDWKECSVNRVTADIEWTNTKDVFISALKKSLSLSKENSPYSLHEESHNDFKRNHSLTNNYQGEYIRRCGQNLRRNEICNHITNIHKDVQHELDDWLIARCPMHIYGCQFSYRRMISCQSDMKYIYSHKLNAFGAQPVRVSLCTNNKDNIKSINITELPHEILLHIATFLDGFTLNSLQNTCFLFHSVCSSLLNEKGIIIQNWVKENEVDKIHWQQYPYQHLFSQACHPISFSRFGEGMDMDKHIRTCSFKIVHMKLEKFSYLPNGTTDIVLQKQKERLIEACKWCNDQRFTCEHKAAMIAKAYRDSQKI